MASIKISDIANEIGCPAREILEKAKELGIKATHNSSQVTLEQAEQIYEYNQTGIKPRSTKPLEKTTIKTSNSKTTNISTKPTHGNDINVTTIDKKTFIEEEIKIHRAAIKEIENRISTFDSRMDVLEKSGDKKGLEMIKIELVKMIGGMQYAQMTISRLEETK
jgi:translation initiation factor IF-2